ncbi:NADH dehydrogenase [ubiquinone] 1 beta subcomplex subunit 3 [Plodia interpunctella]|uniref:NADH dehydrogenase [ubiquinone] 1 beta subcomplex subunit 3 n=1 Tax=Plodia interpunctella TaxID=58824 RepID=UPI002368AD73|nr:NADH dehydrogenase [ubiquinone] 1 beta subcomplex subunit 3 [Plodia interpunctella]XP_053618294.1 NADH dehydrogenase [ubiquinone] 1 beta subcomplex subunit 3 [Plodia interpunctella]XP_053618295.1 NADH dehydrogenase [ubiquinone] 1 beta subcomplex subunit 3 [Plodia interpunctella]XP_053618296.1 NADH dehydrogenase [ubiquinone] 1 beta subcomplex subunit 3 [Plodia interpunctella]XP_053618297.1 NADH dehydrogenase [ubiquinone] 1 beta subcomplex subunit 3 [Plodia interpunctella]
MGGHCHEPAYKIPPYTQFKVKGIPELEELETALAKKGLKDPWIRNEAWRYGPAWGTRLGRAGNFFFRGLPIGLALTIVTVGIEKALGGDDGHHGEGDHH